MNILVTVPFREKHKNKLQEAAQGEKIVYVDVRKEPERYRQLLGEAEIVIGNPSVEELQSAGKLRFLQSTNAGTEKYTERPGFPAHVLLCNMTGAFGGIISEYILGAVLMMYRRFPDYIRQQKLELWQDAGSEQTLMGKTALILGAGDIGTNTAKRLKAFEVCTIGIRRVVREKPDCFDRMETLDALDRLLPEADIVIGCMPKTDKTVHLLDETRLRRIRKNGLLVNAGRGSLIVTEDLVKVLSEGHLMGAVLDVTDPEPLPPEHPLWGMENVLITPHISGISFGHTPQVEDKVARICCQNLKAYLEHSELINVVDWETGYRKVR